MLWPVDWSVVDRAFCDAVSVLPRRQQELAYFHTIRHTEEPRESLHDLNPSVQFGASAVGYCPCIVSSAVLWLRKRMRPLHGAEALQLQGLPLHRYRHCSTLYTSKFLMEMGGNAFSSYHVVPNLLAVFTLFPFDVPQQVPRALPASSTDAALQDKFFFVQARLRISPGRVAAHMCV